MTTAQLFIVTGACGSGKTTVIPELRRLLPRFVVFDADLLQPLEYAISGWSGLAWNVAKSDIGMIVCGNYLPQHFEPIRQKFGTHINFLYLNLHCSDAVRRERLEARGWEEFLIEYSRQFAQNMLELTNQVQPPIQVVITDHLTVEETALRIRDWVLTHYKKPLATG